MEFAFDYTIETTGGKRRAMQEAVEQAKAEGIEALRVQVNGDGEPLFSYTETGLMRYSVVVYGSKGDQG